MLFIIYDSDGYDLTFCITFSLLFDNQEVATIVSTSITGGCRYNGGIVSLVLFKVVALLEVVAYVLAKVALSMIALVDDGIDDSFGGRRHRR